MNRTMLGLLAGLLVIGAVAVGVALSSEPDDVAGDILADTGPASAAEGVSGAGASAPKPEFTYDEADIDVLRDRAPEWEADGWLNTEPLGPTDLEGNVVLYDFWTFGCFNCRNTLPWVTAWHDRYADDGLVLLSVHTAEFESEKDEGRIAAFLEDNGIEYPVALDHDRDVWRAFGNHWWPALYLFDRDGQQRYFHKGEGRYNTTEGHIRALLGVDPASPWADTPPWKT